MKGKVFFFSIFFFYGSLMLTGQQQFSLIFHELVSVITDDVF